MRRIFLGWERPAVESAADLLINEHRVGQWLDLTEVGVAVPGGRASRRLQQRLSEKAAAAGLHFLPPRVVTIGGLPEWCYHVSHPTASPTIQQWSWARALTRIAKEDRERLMGSVAGLSDPPKDRDLWSWPGILQKSYRELTGDGWRFTDIAARLAPTIDLPTRQFWQALARTEEAYRLVLREQGLTDIQQLRFQAVQDQACHVEGPVYLLALVELPQLTIRMLQQAAADVTILVFAPDQWQDRFDDFGRLFPDAWQSLPTPLEDEQWTITRGHATAAKHVARFVSMNHADDPVVGVGDDSLIPYLQRSLAMAGYSGHWAAGASFQNSSAWRLLALVQNYVRTPRVAELTQWSRHPDVEARLLRDGAATNFLSAVDHHFESSLPAAQLPDPDLDLIGTWSQTIARWQKQLPMDEGSLIDHVRALGLLFGDILQGLELSHQDPALRKTLAAYQALAARLNELAELPRDLAPQWGVVDSIQWLMDDLAGQSVPEESPAPTIELLGWLELLLDDSPALCVTGFNEGFIPEPSPKSDLLTPAMREAFGLADEKRRLAREVYILSSFVATRPKLLMVVQQVGKDDDPVAPSRLLFPSDPEEVVCRWHRVLHRVAQEDSLDSFIEPRSGTARPAVSQFAIPDIQPYVRPVTRLRVTHFRSFLACPYRFFLEHVLKLRDVEHLPVEMSPPIFGDFAHNVLAAFGRCDRANSADEKVIFDVIMDFHSTLAAQKFGDDTSPIVRLQLAQLVLRWRYFARKQAEHAANGWNIKYVEQPEANVPIPFVVDQEPIELVGRIDRIDEHAWTNEIMIIDYKTSEKGDGPDTTHRCKTNGWLDLQLPLYRHIARHMGLADPFRLAYFNLAKSAKVCGIKEAKWTASELATADETAYEVVRRIRKGDFGCPTDPPPDYSETWSWICLEGVRERI